MQPYLQFRTGVAIAAIFMAGIGRCAYAQDAPARPQPLAPRVAPTEYQSHAQVGKVTIAADFAGHGVPTPDATFSTDSYVVVEVAFFGPEGARLNMSYKDFSLRVNGKKSMLAAQPYETVFHSLVDPEWAPPPAPEKSSTGISGGGGGGRGQAGDPPPSPPKMPLKMTLAMEQKVKMASIPEGERALPAAGFIFFSYGGKTSGMRSIELIYDGAAGKVTLPLQ
jgi:hypothetical protein